MKRYRTEVIIPPDRQLILHLPDNLPEGRAILLVEVVAPSPSEPNSAELDSSPPDIEWWEEFGDDAELEEPWGLRARLSALEA